MNNVEHPTHYNKEGKKECIDEMVDTFGIRNTIMFALLNAYKYMYRDGLKASANDDRDKALWYLNWSAKNILEYNLLDTACERYYHRVKNMYKKTYLYSK